MTSHVYTFWRDREPLYVGATMDLPSRMRQHRGMPWSRLATFVVAIPVPDDERFDRERDLIQSLRPRFNVHHNPRRQVVPPEVTWQPTSGDRKRAALAEIERGAA